MVVERVSIGIGAATNVLVFTANSRRAGLYLRSLTVGIWVSYDGSSAADFLGHFIASNEELVFTGPATPKGPIRVSAIVGGGSIFATQLDQADVTRGKD